MVPTLLSNRNEAHSQNSIYGKITAPGLNRTMAISAVALAIFAAVAAFAPSLTSLAIPATVITILLITSLALRAFTSAAPSPAAPPLPSVPATSSQISSAAAAAAAAASANPAASTTTLEASLRALAPSMDDYDPARPRKPSDHTGIKAATPQLMDAERTALPPREQMKFFLNCLREERNRITEIFQRTQTVFRKFLQKLDDPHRNDWKPDIGRLDSLAGELIADLAKFNSRIYISTIRLIASRNPSIDFTIQLQQAKRLKSEIKYQHNCGQSLMNLVNTAYDRLPPSESRALIEAWRQALREGTLFRDSTV